MQVATFCLLVSKHCGLPKPCSLVRSRKSPVPSSRPCLQAAHRAQRRSNPAEGTAGRRRGATHSRAAASMASGVGRSEHAEMLKQSRGCHDPKMGTAGEVPRLFSLTLTCLLVLGWVGKDVGLARLWRRWKRFAAGDRTLLTCAATTRADDLILARARSVFAGFESLACHLNLLS